MQLGSLPNILCVDFETRSQQIPEGNPIFMFVCVSSATFALSLMQRDTDPCLNFHQYACGGLTSNVSSRSAHDYIKNQTDFTIEGEISQRNQRTLHVLSSIMVLKNIFLFGEIEERF